MDLKKILLDRFGYENFRPGQEEVIRHVLDNQDTIAILPTGMGKSLCYQLPGSDYGRLGPHHITARIIDGGPGSTHAEKWRKASNRFEFIFAIRRATNGTRTAPKLQIHLRFPRDAFPNLLWSSIEQASDFVSRRG